MSSASLWWRHLMNACEIWVRSHISYDCFRVKIYSTVACHHVMWFDHLVFSRFPGNRMQSIQSTARSSASAVFSPSPSSSSAAAASAVTVGHSRRAMFGNTPQPPNPHTFRGVVPGSVRQQIPQPSVRLHIHLINCLNLNNRFFTARPHCLQCRVLY